MGLRVELGFSRLRDSNELYQQSVLYVLNWTHSLNPLRSWWNIGRLLVPATWPYFEQCASLPATWAVSLPTLPFVCASRCAWVCLSYASPVVSTLLASKLCVRLASSVRDRSSPKLFVLSPGYPTGRCSDCFQSTSLRIFVYATISAGFSSGSYWWTLVISAWISCPWSEPWKHMQSSHLT